MLSFWVDKWSGEREWCRSRVQTMWTDDDLLQTMLWRDSLHSKIELTKTLWMARCVWHVFIMSANALWFDWTTLCSLDKAHCLSGVCKCCVCDLAGLRGNVTAAIIAASTTQGCYQGNVKAENVVSTMENSQERESQRLKPMHNASCIHLHGSLNVDVNIDSRRLRTCIAMTSWSFVWWCCHIYGVSKRQSLSLSYKVMYDTLREWSYHSHFATWNAAFRSDIVSDHWCMRYTQLGWLLSCARVIYWFLFLSQWTLCKKELVLWSVRLMVRPLIPTSMMHWWKTFNWSP